MLRPAQQYKGCSPAVFGLCVSEMTASSLNGKTEGFETRGERERERCIYIYVYIYMAVTSIGGHENGPNPQKIRSFIVKNGQQKPPQNRSGFCCVVGFIFLNFFVFFSLLLLISCCCMTSWNPKTAHQMRLQAYIYIYTHTYTPRHKTNTCRKIFLGN